MTKFIILAAACLSLAVTGCIPFGAGAVVETLTGPQAAPEPPAPIIVQPPSVNITVPVINAAGGDMPTVKANRHGVDVTPPTPFAPTAPEPVAHSGKIQLEGTVHHEGPKCTYKLPDGRVIPCEELGDHVEWIEEGS